MATWLVLKMDEGVLGAFPSRKAALDVFAGGPVRKRYQYGPGAYEYVTGFNAYDTNNFFVETVTSARRAGGWDAVRAWEDAGCPMGRFDTPYPARAYNSVEGH